MAVANGVAIPGGTRGYLQAGSDGANARFVSVDTSGRQLAVGAAASGAAVAGNPVLTAGSDGANARSLLVDASGRQIAVGAAAAAAAAPVGNPVLTGGSDGAAVRTLLTDTGGRQMAVGAAAAGAAPVSNPVLTGGTDGAVVRSRLLDTSGRDIVVGAAAVGAAASGNPVLVSGSDGAAVRALLTDTSGRQIAVGAAASGAAVAGAPVLVGGSDGTNARTFKTDSAGQLYVLSAASQGDAAWSAFAASVQVGNNKSMLSILNGGSSAVVVRMREIWVENVQTTATTGVAGTFELHRFTGHSGGTVITPQAYDTTDTLDVNVTTRTGATITGENAVVLMRHLWSTDEWGPGTLDQEGYDHGVQASQPFWSRKDQAEKPITLRPGEGVHVKFTTNSTNGTFDLTFVFTATTT